MRYKTKIVFSFFLLLSTVLFLEMVYLSNYKSLSHFAKESKQNFVHLVGLPDLALSTEVGFIRHRSLSSMFEIYRDDSTLREYFPSTFVYSHSLDIGEKILDEK